jgi:Transglycosylase
VNARRWIFAVLVLLMVALATAAALAAVTWQSLAARPGEWSHALRFTLAGHTIEHDASIAVLLRGATHPLAARVIDGRSLTTAHGRWLLHARPDGAVAATCQPCRFALPALGPTPLAVERAELVLRSDGADRYDATLTLGAQRRITLAARGAFNRAGDLAIDAAMPPTALADVVHVLGADLPERDSVQVRGTLALSLSAQSQHGPWRIEPRLEGFEVSGLATERLADLQRPAACRVEAQAGVPIIDGWLPRAVIAAEDARFFEHPGYDLKALADALQRNQRPGSTVAGASTLTQQLAKLVVAGDERSASRKLRELLYAVEMERTLGKARILQLYLALAPWGDGICGAERAVRLHLGQRDASAVGPVAAAWLASLLSAPDAHLKAELAAGEIDQARVARVLDAMRPMRAERREKVQVQLLFWSPPALARLRQAAPPIEPAADRPAPDVSALPSAEVSMTPPVAPSP